MLEILFEGYPVLRLLLPLVTVGIAGPAAFGCWIARAILRCPGGEGPDPRRLARELIPLLASAAALTAGILTTPPSATRGRPYGGGDGAGRALAEIRISGIPCDRSGTGPSGRRRDPVGDRGRPYRILACDGDAGPVPGPPQRLGALVADPGGADRKGRGRALGPGPGRVPAPRYPAPAAERFLIAAKCDAGRGPNAGHHHVPEPASQGYLSSNRDRSPPGHQRSPCGIPGASARETPRRGGLFPSSRIAGPGRGAHRLRAPHGRATARAPRRPGGRPLSAGVTAQGAGAIPWTASSGRC